jgi:hypothetical protein
MVWLLKTNKKHRLKKYKIPPKRLCVTHARNFWLSVKTIQLIDWRRKNSNKKKNGHKN